MLSLMVAVLLCYQFRQHHIIEMLRSDNVCWWGVSMGHTSRSQVSLEMQPHNIAFNMHPLKGK